VLALPLVAVIYYWVQLAVLLAIPNWFIALARGRPATGLCAWTERMLRLTVHVNAYTNLLADPYPSFRGWPGTYPIDLLVDPPGRQNRWKTAFRIVLVIPALVLAQVLGVVMTVVVMLGFVFALVMGRYPRGFRDLGAYTLRYSAQTLAYLFLLTDRYPTLASGTAIQFERSAS
jgi:hypothetical protein